jgi:cytochrome c peroxidase
VLDADGKPLHLHDLLGDRIVVLSFVYTSCSNMNGCPLATHVLAGLRRELSEDPSLRDRVRLVTMSFDPENDRPEVMRRHRAHLATADVDWRFLTTDSPETLAPILEAYGQSVRRERDATGRPLGTISHVLRVFLIDREKRIRNVYSASFLHADTVLSDIRTLLLASERAPAAPSQPASLVDGGLHGSPAAAVRAAEPPHAGDDKRGYESADYETRSRSLPARTGAPADLLHRHAEPPLGLPPPPQALPLTPERVALGRKLFFDRRLSHNDTISCAMCHVPEQGFTSNEMATAVGIEGRTVRRNAPTLYNVAYLERLFHDGREGRLEQQVWSPILAANEMGNPSIGYVLDEIGSLPEYAGLFERAFEGQGPTMETVGAALASYERTLQAANSPFDRWRFGGEPEALSPAAKRGFALFTGKAGCSGCHTIAADHALLTDQQFHNTGVGYRAVERAGAPRRVQVAPGSFLTVAPGAIAATEPPPSDVGRYEVSLDPSDRWKYRTPSLRNVALTAPYMHDGSIASLAEVVDLYDAGGIANELLDPRLRPLGLSAGEKGDLVAFLESLTGDGTDAIVADAFAAQVGDPR